MIARRGLIARSGMMISDGIGGEDVLEEHEEADAEDAVVLHQVLNEGIHRRLGLFHMVMPAGIRFGDRVARDPVRGNAPSRSGSELATARAMTIASAIWSDV